jgi:hypothetical protein
MGSYEVTVTVEYCYEVEADSLEEAEKQGWEYEDWSHTGIVSSIEVAEFESDEEEEDAE